MVRQILGKLRRASPRPLEHEVDQGTALRFLQEKYEALLAGVVTEDMLQPADDDEQQEVAT